MGSDTDVISISCPHMTVINRTNINESSRRKPELSGGSQQPVCSGDKLAAAVEPLCTGRQKCEIPIVAIPQACRAVARESEEALFEISCQGMFEHVFKLVNMTLFRCRHA